MEKYLFQLKNRKYLAPQPSNTFVYELLQQVLKCAAVLLCNPLVLNL